VALLSLTPEELLSTTRSVRKRLDLTRPVERAVLEECLALAQQAPSGSNRQGWHFVVVTDTAKRRALGELYRRGWEVYIQQPRQPTGDASPDPSYADTMGRVLASAVYLTEHMGEVPVQVVPCIRGRTDGQPTIFEQATTWGSILPAAWSFMLAARAHGLGTAWTTLHLFFEREAAEVLGIPYAEVMQAALIPVAYTTGSDFRPAPRRSLERMVHWETW
jgi:nitroreductase